MKVALIALLVLVAPAAGVRKYFKVSQPSKRRPHYHDASACVAFHLLYSSQKSYRLAFMWRDQ